MAKQVKPRPAALTSHMGNGVLAAPLPIQLLDNTPGKAAEDGPSNWAPAPMWDTQMKLLAPSFGLIQLWPMQPFWE